MPQATQSLLNSTRAKSGGIGCCGVGTNGADYFLGDYRVDSLKEPTRRTRLSRETSINNTQCDGEGFVNIWQ